MDSLQSLFGEVGRAIPVDILKFDEQSREAVLRVPQNGQQKLRSALTLQGSFREQPCAIHTQRVTAHLISMATDSRQPFV